jgi:sugar phosphate isomerase/epimerase
MKISMQTGGWMPRLFENDFDGALAFIRDNGFTCLDLNVDSQFPDGANGALGGFFDQSIEELLDFYAPLKAAMVKYGVSVGQLHAPFPMAKVGADAAAYPTEHDYAIMAAEKCMALAQMLECPIVVVHPMCLLDNKEREFEMNLEMYRRLTPAAKKYGVTVCLENLFMRRNGHTIAGCCSDVNEACRYIDTLNAEAGQTCFGFCYDTGHAMVAGRWVANDLRRLGKRLKALHIHTNDAFEDLHQIPYTQKDRSGHGLVADWDGFLAALREIGYPGTLNFETYASLNGVPDELISAMLRLTAAIGEYFAKKITE